MFNRIMPFTLACAMAGAAPLAAAQQQTAAGAQKFLGMLAKDLFVQTRDRNGAYLAVTGTRTQTYRWLRDGVPAGDGPYPDHSEPISRSLKAMLTVVKMDSIDRNGNVDDCLTRIETATAEKPGSVSTEDSFIKEETFFSVNRRHYRQTTTEQLEDPAVKFAGPHRVGWGNAVITRAATGRIVAAFFGARGSLELVYNGDAVRDPEMSDRVEYAMKFLKASCDKTAATGF